MGVFVTVGVFVGVGVCIEVGVGMEVAVGVGVSVGLPVAAGIDVCVSLFPFIVLEKLIDDVFVCMTDFLWEYFTFQFKARFFRVSGHQFRKLFHRQRGCFLKGDAKGRRRVMRVFAHPNTHIIPLICKRANFK